MVSLYAMDNYEHIVLPKYLKVHKFCIYVHYYLFILINLLQVRKKPFVLCIYLHVYRVSAQRRGVGGGGVSFLLQIINIKADAVRYDNGPRFYSDIS